jgi:hypothetical protein
MQTRPARHLSRVCYTEQPSPRASLPVGIGPAFQATALPDARPLQSHDRADQLYDIVPELFRRRRAGDPSGKPSWSRSCTSHQHLSTSMPRVRGMAAMAPSRLWTWRRARVWACTSATLSERCRPTSCLQLASLTTPATRPASHTATSSFLRVARVAIGVRRAAPLARRGFSWSAKEFRCRGVVRRLSSLEPGDGTGSRQAHDPHGRAPAQLARHGESQHARARLSRTCVFRSKPS